MITLTPSRGAAVRFTAAIAASLALFAAACNLSGSRSSPAGTLGLSLDITAQGHPLENDVHHYRVIGYRPASASTPRFDESFPSSGGLVEIRNLQPGRWRFDVEARKADNTVIFFGTDTVTIAADSVSELTITLIPDGEGELVIQFRWPSDVEYIDIDSIDAGIARYSGDNEFGDTVDLEPFVGFVDGEQSGLRYEGTHDAGHYRLSYEVLDDDGQPLTQFTPPSPDTFWVIPDEVVTLIIDLETGTIEIEIELDPQQPLSVDLLDVMPTLQAGESMTVGAHVDGGNPPYTYRWYLNGIRQENVSGSEFTVGASLDPGRYRLTLIVSDAQLLGSAWESFDVLP